MDNFWISGIEPDSHSHVIEETDFTLNQNFSDPQSSQYSQYTNYGNPSIPASTFNFTTPPWNVPDPPSFFRESDFTPQFGDSGHASQPSNYPLWNEPNHNATYV